MLSALEHDKYIPNAQLLMALCRRLQIDLTTISLATNYAISAEANLNQRLVDLCAAHSYTELRTFLEQPATIAGVGITVQEQAYYYYLGVSQINTSHYQDGMHSLHTALTTVARADTSALTRLCQMALAYAEVKSGRNTAAVAFRQSATDGLAATPYTENLNIIGYLDALIAYEQADYARAARLLTANIEYIGAHNSHYMLINCYYLLAKAAAHLNQLNQARDAKVRQQVLADLFAENVHHVE